MVLKLVSLMIMVIKIRAKNCTRKNVKILIPKLLNKIALSKLNRKISENDRVNPLLLQ